MVNPEAVFEHTRSRLLELLAHELRSSGSVEIARQSLARRLRVSKMWIRRIVGRYDGVTIQAHQFLNLEELHRLSIHLGNRIERIERMADEAKAEALRLEGKIGCMHGIFESGSEAGVLAATVRRSSKTA